MSRPFFVQGLSSILTSVLIVQFAFADLAMAQSSPPVMPNTGNPTTDPFWSNTANTGLPTDPNQSPFWFNAPANPADPTQPSSNDPWGGWTDPNSGGWNNSGASGDWSNTSDPYSSLNNYWGTSTISQPNPTDPFSVQIMKWTGLVSKNYAPQTRADRVRYGAYSSEDNEALADIIIHKYSVRSGYTGAAASTGLLLINYLQADATAAGGNLGWGYGTGMVLGGLADFINVITQEANMMFELQEIYGDVSNDPDERTAQSLIPFYLGAVEGGASQWLVRKFGLMGPVIPIPNPNPFPPGPDPVPNPAPNPPTPPAPAPAAKAAAKSGAKSGAKTGARKSLAQRAAEQNEAAVVAERGQIKSQIVHSEGAQEVGNGLFKRLIKRTGWRSKQPLADLDAASMRMADETGLAVKLDRMAPLMKTKFGKDWAPKFIKKLPTATRILMAIAINYQLDYWTCYAFGRWAKRAYRPLHKITLANSISLLRVNPRARTTLWLLMLRDFLPNMEDQNDAKMYASILLKEVPLVRNSKHDELKQMLLDYQADPKLIDEDLAALRSDAAFPEPAKLHLIKLLYAAALMKGYPTASEQKSIDTVAVGLGLIPPAQLASQAQQLEMQNPGDPRIMTKNRYYDMLFLMNKAANKTQFVQAPDQVQQQHDVFYNAGHFVAYNFGITDTPIKKPRGYVVARKWRSGQIILQDYQDAGVPDAAELFDEIHANQGLINPALQQKIQNVANKLATPPPGTQAPPPLQPGNLQPPVSSAVPGVKPPATGAANQANGVGTQPTGTQSQQPSFPNSPNTYDPFPDWNSQNAGTAQPTSQPGQHPSQTAPIPNAPSSAPKPPSPPTGTAGIGTGTHS